MAVRLLVTSSMAVLTCSIELDALLHRRGLGLGVLGYLVNGSAQLFHRGARLFEGGGLRLRAFGHVGRGGAQGLAGGRHPVRAVLNPPHQLVELLHHEIERRGKLANLVLSDDLEALSQVAFGNDLGKRDPAGERARNGYRKEEPEQEGEERTDNEPDHRGQPDLG